MHSNLILPVGAEQTRLLYTGTYVKKAIGPSEELPIYPSTAYALQGLDDYDSACAGEKYYYNRSGNPNRDALADAVTEIEHGESSLIFSSGMAAISAVMLGLLKQGARAVVNRSLYGETQELLDLLLSRYGVRVDYVDFQDSKALHDAAQKGADLFYTETLTNPRTQVVDIDSVARIAHSAGALLAVDSTFTTPWLIRPLDHGADLVIHSLTKYFSGHSDISGGSVTASADLIELLEPQAALLGACLSAQECWLTLRSMRTMELRVSRQNANALALAQALKKHPKVSRVFYPGLAEHPDHARARELYHEKFGAIVTFQIEDSRNAADRYIKQLKMIRYLGTLGGLRTSIAHPATAFRGVFPDEKLHAMGLTEGLLRISVGIEDPADIIADALQALNTL